MSIHFARRLVATAAVGAIATGMAVSGASAATAPAPVPASCQTALVDVVGLANNMLGAIQADNPSLVQVNDNADATFSASSACSSVLSSTVDNNLFLFQLDLPKAALAFDEDGQTATAVSDLDAGIAGVESIQSQLGLPVGGSVPEATPPNPNVPAACVEDLDVWSGDTNTILTFIGQDNATASKPYLQAIEQFPAAAGCASSLTAAQDGQLTTALQDLVTATSQAANKNFTAAETNASAASSIINNTQHILGLFFTI